MIVAIGILGGLLLVAGFILIVMAFVFDDNPFYGGIGVLSLIFGIVLIAVYSAIGTTTNVNYLKSNAAEYFANNKMAIVAYEGYVRTPVWGSYWGGGKLWYHVCYTNKPSVIYNCYLARWGEDNIQLWEFKPINTYIVADGSGTIKLQ